MNLAEVAKPHPEQEPVSADSPVEQPSESKQDSTRAPQPVQSPMPEDGRSGPREEAHALPMPGYHPASSLTRIPEAVGKFEVQPPSGGDTGLAGKITIRIWLSCASI